MADEETKLRIELEAEGFEDATEEASDFADQLGESGIGAAAGEAEDALKDLDRSLGGLGRGLSQINRQLHEMEDRLKRIDRLGAPRGSGSGSGGGGGAEGVSGGGAAGAGGKGGGWAGGAARLGFGAMKGMAAAAGGAAGVALWKGAASAEENLNLQRATIAMGGNLRGPAGHAQEVDDLLGAGRYKKEAAEMDLAARRAQILEAGQAYKDAHSSQGGGSTFLGDKLERRIDRPIFKKISSDALDEAGKKQLVGVGDLRGKASNEASGMGALTHAMQAYGGKDAIAGREWASEFLGRGGGNLKGAQSSNDLVSQAISAQTLYGASPRATGGVLAGSRSRGSMAGAEGGGDFLEQTISQALLSGLDRSEIAGFLESMSAEQEQWTKTGLPINPASFLGGVNALTGAGFSGARATGIADGARGRARGIAANGVQDADEFAALQTLGGYQGGGLKGYVDALRAMESGGDQSKLRELAGRYLEGAGGDKDSAALRMSKGMGISLHDADTFIGAKTGDMTADQREQLRLNAETRRLGAQEAGMPMKDAAGRLIGQHASGVASSAALSTQSILQGEKFIKFAQGIEKASLEGVGTIAVFSKELGIAAKWLAELSHGVQEYVAKVRHQ